MELVFREDGFMECPKCRLLLKGGTPEKTESAVKDHLFRVHGILVGSDDDSRVNFPYYIPPDRNGLSPVQPKRFDHPVHMKSEKLYFKGGLK